MQNYREEMAMERVVEMSSLENGGLEAAMEELLGLRNGFCHLVWLLSSSFPASTFSSRFLHTFLTYCTPLYATLCKFDTCANLIGLHPSRFQ